MDFTLKKYGELLSALKGYGEITLRHDVDREPVNSLLTARMEAGSGIKAEYYFRTVPQSWNEQIMREIASLGHEVGYHYESLTTCKGDIDAAWEDFKTNLSLLREIVPSVHLICMHGSPRSKWDSRDIWNKYDYRTVGVDCESYLDTDFSSVFYLTDTGRRWDGWKVSVRDKIEGHQDRWISEGQVYHSTDDIIQAVRKGRFPRKALITIHPQRWSSTVGGWLAELVCQNAKNLIKSVIVTLRPLRS